MPRAASLGARCVAPSASLLVAFTAVSTSASPVVGLKPLSFLYPNYPADILDNVQSEPVSSVFARSPAPSKRKVDNILPGGNLPVRYSKGPDGMYRKDEEVVTLYGSTIVGNARAVPTSQPTPSPISSEFLDSLPIGWKPEDRDTRTGLILALSLVLAFFICCLIIACIFWRNNVRKKARRRDPELTAKKHTPRVSLAENEGRSEEKEKEIIKRLKLWTKATARWKANARHTARQRRGRRLSSPRPQTGAATSSFALWSPLESPEEVSPVSSLSISDSPSISGASQDTSDSLSLPPQSAVDEPTSFYPPPSPSIAGPNSPPAYPSDSSSYHAVASTSKSAYLAQDQVPDQESPAAYFPSSHFAHIAVDDKSRFEQLSRLAGAPPSLQGPSHAAVSGSAPAWPDDDFEELDFPEASRSMDVPLQHSAMFPPPPSQSQIPTYDYSFTLDIMDDLPDPEPSAPPFEENQTTENSGPSAPPLDESMFYDAPSLQNADLVPSAPPPDDPDPPVPLPT